MSQQDKSSSHGTHISTPEEYVGIDASFQRNVEDDATITSPDHDCDYPYPQVDINNSLQSISRVTHVLPGLVLLTFADHGSFMFWHQLINNSSRPCDIIVF
jgi:hypothetical protein